jgi:hypothetical protein
MRPAALGPNVVALLTMERWVPVPAVVEPSLPLAKPMAAAGADPLADVGRAASQSGPPADHLAVAGRVIEQPAEAVAGPAALWLDDAEPDPEQAAADRTALRQALSGRYDSHARIVSRTLSEEPGLRAVAGSFADITAGLVAVRAYLLDERATVNEVLRGDGSDAQQVQRVLLLSRSAVYGLRRLPSVFGPVFRTAPAEPAVVSGYRPGDELVEPAFVDVGLANGAADAGVEFAIWSVSAHRLAGIDPEEGTALFPPGSRFAVLAVDEPRDGQAQVRVLLRDLAAVRRGRGGARGGPADTAERILARLREATRGGGAGRPRPLGPRTTFPIGLDKAGRRYRRPAGPGSHPSASL